MSCAACAATIEKNVRKLPGVSKVEVNLLANSMQVQYDSSLLNPQQIEKAVRNAGFEAELFQVKLVLQVRVIVFPAWRYGLTLLKPNCA